LVSPLHDSVGHARTPGGGVLCHEPRQRRVQPAGGCDSPVPALLLHGRRNGEGDRSVGGSDVTARCRSTHHATATNTSSKKMPPTANARMSVGVGVNNEL